MEPNSFALHALWNLVEIGHRTGNAWLRFAGYLQLWWFGLLLGVALFPVNGLIAVLTFMPLVAWLLLLRIEPVGLAVLWSLEKTKDDVETLVKTASTIAGVQMAIGIAMWLIPLHQDRGLVPWFVATLAAIVLIGIGGKTKLVKTLLMVVAISMTGIFIMGGREAASEKINEAKQTQQTQSVTVQQSSNNYRQNIFGFSNSNNNVVISAPPAPPTTIRVNELPEVSITSPKNGDIFEKFQYINFSVSASDDVEIAFVNIYANSALIGNLTSPYTLTRFLEMEGEIELIAAAFDSDNAVTYSEPITITITND